MRANKCQAVVFLTPRANKCQAVVFLTPRVGAWLKHPFMAGLTDFIQAVKFLKQESLTLVVEVCPRAQVAA